MPHNFLARAGFFAEDSWGENAQVLTRENLESALGWKQAQAFQVLRETSTRKKNVIFCKALLRASL
jgi:hypothetical protein